MIQKRVTNKLNLSIHKRENNKYLRKVFLCEKMNTLLLGKNIFLYSVSLYCIWCLARHKQQKTKWIVGKKEDEDVSRTHHCVNSNKRGKKSKRRNEIHHQFQSHWNVNIYLQYQHHFY